MHLTAFAMLDADRGTAPADLPDAGWLPADVPGGVHEALLAAGRIDHPYRGRTVDGLRWIEERDWWFRTTFPAPAAAPAEAADPAAPAAPADPARRVRLVCHGLDTVVDLWLNGEELGHHENMFRPAEFDVTARLRDGDNELLLRFSPPLDGLAVPASATALYERLAAVFAALSEEGEEKPQEDEDDGGGMMAALPLASQRRKAACSWGWDFGPRLPSIGIWRPVELRTDTAAALTGHHLATDTVDADGTATVAVRVEADAFGTDAPLTARVDLTAPDGTRTTADLPVADGLAQGTLTLPAADLWWTHDLGTPALHDATVTLLDGDTVLDRATDRIGIRTLTLDRTPDDEGGRLFRLLLNGVPVFARGASWLPADLLHGSVTDDRLRALVALARDGGMTMLRVWGGGIYEHDAFYRACDENGVLVWQDFMFACIDYPESDPALAREVEQEAAYQVRRLRNHPSLALWCGNNEVHALHGAAYRDHEPGDWGHTFFHRTLPDAVAAHDGRTPYWPGSPYGEESDPGADAWTAVNGERDGDRHAWEVWHGLTLGPDAPAFPTPGDARHYRRYADDRGKFISEFGIHAAPELSTLRRHLPGDDLRPGSAALAHRNKDRPKNKHDAILEIVTGLPESMEQYVDFTMASQAEGLKFGVEHYRRRAPHCNGALVWQFNDVWPGLSWSLVDHDLVPKAAYHYLARAFAPLLASFRRTPGDDNALELWLSNSGRAPAHVHRAAVTLAGFDGTQHLHHEITATLAAGESRKIWHGTDLALTADRYAWVESPDGAFPANRRYFAEIKDIPFGTPALDVTAEPAGPGTARLTVTAAGFAHFTHALTPHPGVRFDTNYLDLRDGDSAVITATGLPDGFDPAAIEIRAWGQGR